MTTANDDDSAGFVSRWSRRKSVARRRNDAPPPPDSEPGKTELAADRADLQAAGTASSVDSLLRTPGNEPPTEENQDASALVSEAHDSQVAQPPTEPLPSIESLTEESDYSAFMAPNVSAELRTLALRKLFKSSVFNIRDGLDDYDEDFTTFEKLGDIITADMRHHAQRKEQEQREEEQLAQQDAESGDGQSDAESLSDPETQGTDLAGQPDDQMPTGEPDSQDKLASEQAINSPANEPSDPAGLAGGNFVNGSVVPGSQQVASGLSGKLRRKPGQA